jgi:dTDP-4-amino-4,6-dideoxygalactose transaminase
MAERYTRELANIDGLSTPFVPDWARPNYQSYAVRVGPKFGMTRDELMQAMLDRGISTRRGVMNSHQEPAYAGDAQTTPFPLPNSESARDNAILLPLHHALADEDQAYVIDALRELAGRTAAPVLSRAPVAAYAR